jgi:hypothetical protein
MASCGDPPFLPTRRWDRFGSALIPEGEFGQLLGSRFVKAQPASAEFEVQSKGESVQFGGIDPPGDVDQIGRGHLAEGLTASLQFGFEPEHHLKRLGMSLFRAADDEA